MAHLIRFLILKLHSFMDTNPTVNNMSKSNRISASIYIFEIRNKVIPFLFLFFSFLSFPFLVLNFPASIFPVSEMINIHLPVWAIPFTSPAEHAPRIESNSVFKIYHEKERAVLEGILRWGSTFMVIVFAFVKALPSC